MAGNELAKHRYEKFRNIDEKITKAAEKEN
jgi:hypothetical protein